ncbi:MAG: hypothetical protein HYR75_05640 [Gemmatimonadetes bacterium]|nr:hypothetical protein [Gemmatimonadota bacterium]MBI3566910.1 hypothetical protein [Gemmatimonadota bacterium]
MTMMIRPRARWMVLAAAALTLVACGKKEDDGKIPLSAEAKMPADSVHKGMVQPVPALEALPPAAQAALDSGNALFRKKLYAQAMERYRATEKLVPNHPSAVYGIYMVARATNDTTLADSALAVIKKYNAVMPHGKMDSTAALEAHKKAGVTLPPKG